MRRLNYAMQLISQLDLLNYAIQQRIIQNQHSILTSKPNHKTSPTTKTEKLPASTAFSSRDYPVKT